MVLHSELKGNSALPHSTLLYWGDLDQDQLSEIIQIINLRCIKRANESVIRVKSSDPLMYNNLSGFGSLTLIQITPKEHTFTCIHACRRLKFSAEMKNVYYKPVNKAQNISEQELHHVHVSHHASSTFLKFTRIVMSVHSPTLQSFLIHLQKQTNHCKIAPA